MFLSHDSKLIPKPSDFPEWFLNVGKLSRSELPYTEQDYSSCSNFINKRANGTIYIGNQKFYILLILTKVIRTGEYARIQQN